MTVTLVRRRLLRLDRAIALVGAALAGLVHYLQPVCVALLSFVVLGERTGPAQIVSMVLILGGVLLGTSGRVK